MAALGDNSPPSSLLVLPEELSLAIIEELDMASIIALSQTCRQFHRLSNPHDPSKRDELLDFLLKAQDFPRWKDGFACFSCTKVLPRERFSERQSGARLEQCEEEGGRGGHYIIDGKTRRSSEASVCVPSELGVYVSRTFPMAPRITTFIAMHCKSI